MAVTGQLWFTAEGDPTDARIAYINDDGTNQTVQVDNSPTTDLITGFVQEIGLDTAAGWYFAIVNGGNLGSGAHLVRGSIGTPGPVVDIVIADFIVGNDPGDSNNDDIIVNALHVDNINEKIYVTYQDPNGNAPTTGIRQYSYNPLTGAVTDDGFLVRADQDNTKPLANGGLDLLDVRDFDLDLTTNTLYFTELLTGGVQEMGLYRMDLTTKVITQMVSSTAFPDTGTNGFIIDVEVDPTTDLVYFTSESQAPFGAASGYNANHNAIWVVAQNATNATPTKVTLVGMPGGSHIYPGDMVFDQNKRQLYVESEEGNSGSTDDVIYVFQLDGAGTTATLINTINQTPEFTNSGANFGGMAFDILAEIGTLNGTSVHAVEQGANIDLLTAAPTITDTDGDHLNNATVTISGSFSGSGDNLFVLDGATQRTSGTFTGTNITVTRTVDGSGNQKLTLSGYDTLVNYQNVLNAVGFASTGDNPTNYGNNITRTVTWQVNDGAAGNPSGTVNGSDTNVRTSSFTIDAVNDAPVNNLPGTPSIAEDVLTTISGITITDVDADPANQDIQVTFSVQHGKLTINTGVAGGITAGDITAGANGSNTITITATQNQINATLGNATGLRYQSDLNFNSGFATETLHIVTSDLGHTDSTAFPSTQTDTDDLTLNITAVNDNPNLQPDTTSAVGYTENAAPTAIFTGQNIDTPLADVDQSANYAGGSIDLNITAGLVSGDRISLIGSRFVISGGNIQDTLNGNAVVGTIGATNATAHVTVSSLTSAATPSVVDALLKSFGYDSTSDNPGGGDRTITLTFNDGGNTGSGGALTDAVTQTVNVTPVNDNPVSTITPTTYSATEQVALSLKNNGLAVSDVDGNSGIETITLSVTEGTLTVSAGTSGVSIDSGNGTGSVTISGTITQLNNFLNTNATSTISYIDNTNTPSASATLTMLIHDNGNSGTGGDLTGTDTATINITAVNDTPTATLGTDPYAATENVALDIKNTGMSVADVDAGSGIVVATLSVTQGIINASAGTSGVTVGGDGTSSVTLTGTLAQINALLNTDGTSTVSYTETNDNPSATVTLTLQINDQGNTGTGGSLTGSDTSTINITAVNDAPVATITPTTYSATEQVALSLKNNGLAVSDVDGNAGSETITLAVTEGTITVAAGTSGVTIDSGNGTGSVVISGTIAQLNDFLNTNATSTISYIDNTDTPGASATLTLTIHDNGNTGTGGDLSANDTATINLTAVNDAPVATMTTDPYSATEQVGLVLKGTGMSVSDVDSLGGVETITLSVGEGALTVVEGDSGVTIVSGNGTSSVQVSGTIAQLNALLAAGGTSNITYIDSSDNPSASTTLTLSVNDGGNTGTGGAQTGNDTSTINITAVNDAPDANITPTSYAGTPGSPIDLKNNGLSVSDVDGNAGSETVTLSVTSGTLTVTAGTSGAGVAGSGTNSVTITGTIAQINALLNTDATSTVSFEDATGGGKTLTLLIHDNGNTGGGDLSDQDTATINLGEPPVIANLGGDSVSFTEGGVFVVLDNSTPASVTDNDSANFDGGSLTATITNVVGTEDVLGIATQVGVVDLSDNTNVGSEVSINGVVIGTIAAGGTGLNGNPLIITFDSDATPGAVGILIQHLVYDNLNDVNPSTTARSIDVKVDDGTGATDTETVTVNVTATNDGPTSVITPTSYSATEQVALNLKNNGLAVADGDAGAGSVTVTLSVTEGTLTVTAGGSGAGVAGSGTSSVTLTGTIAQINALLTTDATSTVSYTDGSDNPSASATLTLAINDNGNTGTGGNLAAQDTATINITPVNDAPVATITPPTYNATENITLNLKTNGLSVSDIDGNAGSMTVTLSVTEGTLNVQAGGSGAVVSGSPGTSVTITGTLAQINALLQTDGTSVVQYTETNNAPSATVTLTLAIDDNGNTGGGNLSNSDTATINITPANDAPVAIITPASYSATENAALSLKNNGLAVSDDATSGNMTVTLSVTEGTLTVTAGGSGATVNNSGTASVTITGTLAQINALLTTDGTSTVSYTDNNDNPSATATLTLAIDDNGNTGGGSLTASDTATINITPANDAPTATIAPPTYSATENITLNLKTNGLSVSDAADGNFGSMTVTLSVTEGTLNVQAGSSGAVVSGSPGTSVTITGTVAQINALLQTDGTSVVQYTETDDTPSAAVTLTLAIDDNGNTGGGPGLTAQDTATINITAVNDAPVIGNLTPSVTYLAASPPQTLSSGATVTDPDTATLTSASVTITDHQTGDELSVNGVLNGGPVNGISWTYTAATGVLAFTGSSSLANYQALLDQVQFRSTAADPSNGGATNTRDVAWVANDGTDPSVTQHTEISLGNQAPVVDLNGGGGGNNFDQSFTEGAGAVAIAPAAAAITDTDDANLASATIVLTNAKAGDSLSISGSLPGGIGSNITTGVGTITVTLSGNASKADYQTAIQQVVFNNSSDNPDLTDRQISVTVNDGEDDSNSPVTTVHVGGVNDGPVNTVPATQNIEANTPTAISGLSVADADSGGASITTTLSVAHGTLTVASAGGAAVSGSGTGTVTLTGSVAAINTTLAAANNVVYTGAHDFFGTDSLTVLTNDGGNSGTGGSLTDTDNVTLNLNTLITGTTGNDSYNALPGQERIDAGSGIDTITFNFRLVDASVKYEGNKVIIDGPSGSHTVLTGFEVFNFTDGTVNNNDGSPLIDDLYYYSKYHDVWNAHVDADAHYNSFGWHEGRNPDAFFSTVVYLSANPDVKASGMNPLSHFDTFGWKEGRVPSINFDPAAYLAANPDVAAANVDPLRHFLQFGAGEGRQPIAPTELVAPNGFDYVYYMNTYPDIANTGVDPFLHFQTVGWQENRNPNALFDTLGYKTNYPDVKGNPLDHYNQFGWHENRDPSVGFDTSSYLAAYADVKAANINPLTHFLDYGIHESRSPFADGIWG